MKIAIFCPNLIGDTVMATPTFRALRRGFPGAIAVGRHQAPGGADARRHRLVRRVDPLRPSVAQRVNSEPSRCCERSEGLGSTWRSCCRTRSGLRWMAWLAGIPRRVGYERHGRGILLTDVLHHPLDAHGRRLPAPIVEAYLKLARHLGCPVDRSGSSWPRRRPTRPPPTGPCAELGIDDGDRIVCLNTGGAFGPAKNWPTGHFADLARRLAEQSGVHVLVLCGPRERENAREIVAAARSRPRGQPGRSGAGHRPDESLRPPLGALDHDRLGPAALRRGVRHAGDHAVRADITSHGRERITAWHGM